MTREIGIFGSGDVLIVFPNGLNVNLCTGVGAYADDCESATIFQPRTHYDADCCKPWTRREVHYGSTCEVAVYRGDENVTAWFGPAVYLGGEPVLGHLTPVEAVDLLHRVSTWARWTTSRTTCSRRSVSPTTMRRPRRMLGTDRQEVDNDG